MKQYDEAKQLLQSVPNLQQQKKNYEAELSILQLHSGAATSERISQIKYKISVIQDTIAMIDTVIGQLNPDEQRIIELWYIEKLTKREIIERLHYSSATSAYKLWRKAMLHFTNIYPW